MKGLVELFATNKKKGVKPECVLCRVCAQFYTVNLCDYSTNTYGKNHSWPLPMVSLQMCTTQPLVSQQVNTVLSPCRRCLYS